MNEISDLIFNNCLKRSSYDKRIFAFFYKYCLKIMKSYVDKHFGNNSRYKDVPHDVFTRIVFDYPPKHFVTNHVAYLCRSVKNFIIDFNNSKNNHLELGASKSNTSPASPQLSISLTKSYVMPSLSPV